MKITIKYHIEAFVDAQQVVIECDSLEQAEKKFKNYISSGSEAYLFKTVNTGKSTKEVFLIS